MRFWYFIGVISSLALLAIAYFHFQLKMGLIPCPLCMFQRAALVGVAAFSLLGLLTNPKGFGQRLTNFFITVSAFTGAFFAGRQVWLQYFPAAKGEGCGIDPIYQWSEAIGENTGFTQMVKNVFKGSGDCSEIDWAFMGISMGGCMLTH